MSSGGRWEVIHAQVAMPWRERVLLGDVCGASHDGVLVVRHFNGEPWPVKPMWCDVQVLDRG